MAFLWIKLVMIENNSSTTHREYHEFYAVHVYLRSIRLSLLQTILIFSRHTKSGITKKALCYQLTVDRQKDGAFSKKVNI